MSLSKIIFSGIEEITLTEYFYLSRNQISRTNIFTHCCPCRPDDHDSSRAGFSQELPRGVYVEVGKIRGAPVHPSTVSWIRPCGGGMSGGASLGLRPSGSYGSLPQQPQQQLGGCHSSPSPAPSVSPPLAARKPAKMSLGGAGGGGPRVFARICKLAGRRQRMLLLLLVAVAVAFCFLFSSLVSKGGGWLASCSTSNP